MVLKAPLEVLGLGALGCEASARHERREEIRVLHHDLGPEHILGFRMDGRIRGIGRRKKQDWFGGTALWSANRFGAKILSPNSDQRYSAKLHHLSSRKRRHALHLLLFC